MSRQRPGKKTGPKPQFSADDVVRCALAEGLDRFTIAQVASHLGVVPSAVYRHVRNRDDIVMRALAYVAAQLQLPDANGSWQEILRQMVDSIWELYARYRGLGTVIVQTPGAHVHMQRYINDLVALLLKADFPGDRGRALFAIDFLADITAGTALFMEHYELEDDQGRSGYDRAQAIFADSTWMPADLEPVYPPDPSWHNRGFLHQKVDFIIEALQTLPPSREYDREMPRQGTGDGN
ncbi:MAG: hypothetical protein Q4Q03_06930 [Bowdeniella nasicola]|nr:hypothetical protein [Bowdeniella nasicola]